MNWKPIESAPKDGTKILLYYPDEENAITSGWWEEDRKIWNPIALPYHGCGCCGENNSEPTHWMELPNIPN